MQTIISRIALERGITIELNIEVAAIDTVQGEDHLISKDGRRFHFDEAVWCTEVLFHLDLGPEFQIIHVIFISVHTYYFYYHSHNVLLT